MAGFVGVPLAGTQFIVETHGLGSVRNFFSILDTDGGVYCDFAEKTIEKWAATEVTLAGFLWTAPTTPTLCF